MTVTENPFQFFFEPNGLSSVCHSFLDCHSFMDSRCPIEKKGTLCMVFLGLLIFSHLQPYISSSEATTIGVHAALSNSSQTPNTLSRRTLSLVHLVGGLGRDDADGDIVTS